MLETTKFDTLCFIGGGAKGYVNPGSYKAFYESGLLNDISTFTGASVGALTSCFTAFGIDPDTLHQKLSAQPVNELLGKGSWWSFGTLQRDGSGLRDLLGNIIKEEVKNFLDKNPATSHLTSDEQQIIDNLKETINKNEPLDLRMSDLALLRKLNPDKFKNLVVVAVDKDTESLQQFSSVDQTELIKDWLMAINKSQSIVDKTEFAKEDLETLSKVFEMGIEWKDSNSKDLGDLEIKISDLQDKKVIQNCINNVKNLLKNNDIKTLAERTSKDNFQLNKTDLETIKNFDSSRDYSIITDKDGKTNIFSNVSVIDATLASAALPGVLKNVDINGKAFADGGQLKNMPYDIIKTDGDSLVIGFKNDEMHRALHNNSSEKIYSVKALRRIFEAILRFLGVAIKKHNEQIKNREFQNLRDEKALTTIPNNTAGVETTDFKKANRQKDEGFLRGYLSTMNHLILYNYHPKAQEIIRLEKQNREQIIKQNQSLKDNHETIENFTKQIESKEKTVDNNSNDNLQELRIQRKNLSIDLESAVQKHLITNQELNQKAKDFQQFRENFEIRKFVFDAIDKYKSIDRKSDWYKDMINFCMDQNNFHGNPQEVFKTAITKFIGNESILRVALNSSGISSEIISQKFAEYCKKPDRNEQIAEAINDSKNNTKWRQSLQEKAEEQSSSQLIQ